MAAAKPLAVAEPVALTLAALLCVLAWIDPNHYDPWTAFHTQLWMSAGALIVAAWVAGRSFQGARSYELPRASLAFLALAGVPWLQWSLGVIYFRGDAWIVSLYFVAAALAIATGANLARLFGAARLLDFIAGMYLAAGLLSAWLALYQYLGLTYLWQFGLETRPDGRVVANLAQPNQLAVLLVMALLSLGWFWTRRAAASAYALAGVLVLVVPLSLTGSRAGALVAMGAFFWLAVGGIHRQHRLGMKAAASFAAAAAAGIALALSLAALVASVEGEATATRTLESISDPGLRPIHWASMLDASLRRPWTGFGWNQTIVAQYHVAIDHPTSFEVIASAHNLPLDVMVAVGAGTGAILLILVSIWVAVRVWRARTTEDLFAAAFVLAFCAYSMVEFPNEYTYFLLPVCALLGGMSRSAVPKTSAQIHPAAALLLIVGVAGMLAWTANDYFNVEQKLRDVRFVQARIGVGKPRPVRPVVHLLDQIDAFLLFVDTPDADGMSPEQLDTFAKVAQRYPNWTALSRWAAALSRNGDPSGAAAALSRICKTHTAEDCERARRQWSALGKKTPALAAVPWPLEAPRHP